MICGRPGATWGSPSRRMCSVLAMARCRPATVSRLMLASVCTSAFILGGCGGGESAGAGGGTNSVASADANFIAKGEAICREASRAGQSLRPPVNEAGLGPFFARALTLSQDEVDKLNALQPPTNKAGAYETWLSGLQQAIGSLKSAAAAAKAGKSTQVQAIIREAGAVTERNLTYAKAVGLTACSKEG